MGPVEDQDGFRLRRISPPCIDRSHMETLGSPDEDQFLTQLYYFHAKWLEEWKKVCQSSGKSLEQYLREGLSLSIKDKRVRDCSYETALGLLQGGGIKGQDVLHFFVMKCPHARDAFLRGELPPYPWRSGAADLVKQPATPETKPDSTPAQNINIIQNFKNIVGPVHGGPVQTGDQASINNQDEPEKKKGIVNRLLKFIGAIIVGIIVTVLTDILGDFGWIERIKTFISGK